jgi:hypothetical protein
MVSAPLSRGPSLISTPTRGRSSVEELKDGHCFGLFSLYKLCLTFVASSSNHHQHGYLLVIDMESILTVQDPFTTRQTTSHLFPRPSSQPFPTSTKVNVNSPHVGQPRWSLFSLTRHLHRLVPGRLAALARLHLWSEGIYS